MSVLITFEGGDGSGKSTQAALLHKSLVEEGHDVVLLQEPGGTALGSSVRTWLKSQHPGNKSLSPVSELFLFAAARAQLVKEVLKPSLDKPGTVVICDRYMDSTVAYQGYGRDLGIEMVRSVNEVAIDGVAPDLTFLIDLAPDAADERVTPKVSLHQDGNGAPADPRAEVEGMRRFEEASEAFRKRVYDGYLIMARKERDRWRVVDGDRPIKEIADEIRTLAGQALPSIAAKPETPGDSGDSGDSGDKSQPNLF